MTECGHTPELCIPLMDSLKSDCNIENLAGMGIGWSRFHFRCPRWHLVMFLIAAHGPTGSVVAQLVSHDGFEGYSAGVQVESGVNGSEGAGLNGGAAWASAYNVSNAIKSLVKIEDRSASPIHYSAGDITIDGGDRAMRFYDIANGTYAVRRRLGIPFSAAAGESLWFSFLFRTASESPLMDQDFLQLGFDDNPNASNGNPRVSIGANTTSSTFPSAFRFFARSTTDPNSSTFDDTVDIEAATTYLLVGHIQPNAGNYDTVSLFINPTSTAFPGHPSATIQEASGLGTLTQMFIRTAGLDFGDAFVVDEIHVGRDYGSVVQSLAKALRVHTFLPAPTLPVLRWPVSITGIVLQTSPTMAPGTWEDVPGPYTQNGSEYEFPIPVEPGIDRKFFRLKRF